MASALRWLRACALSFALFACHREPAEGPGGKPTARRIVLVTVDTLRLDTLMGAAGRPSAMPLTKAWVEANLRFDRCFSSASSTDPTHAALFTGLAPWLADVTTNGQVLDDAHETLAERLRADHWFTSAVVSSVPVGRRFGFGQGFDRFLEDFDRGARDSWAGHDLGPKNPFYALSEKSVAAAMTALDSAEGDKQFFWFHFFDVHGPYGDAAGKPLLYEPQIERAVIEGRGRRPRGTPGDILARAHDLYDADARVLDRHLARLLERLGRESATRATTVVLTADHGESFGEDGTFSHGRDVSDVQNHVPCVLSGTGIPTGARTDVAGSADLFATILARAGLTPPDGRGRDLLATSDGPGTIGLRPTFAEPREVVHADGSSERVDYDRFFVVLPDGTFLRSRGVELDPPVELDPTTRAGVLAQFRVAAEALAARRDSGAPRLSPETEAQLRALGYLR